MDFVELTVEGKSMEFLFLSFPLQIYLQIEVTSLTLGSLQVIRTVSEDSAPFSVLLVGVTAPRELELLSFVTDRSSSLH